MLAFSFLCRTFSDVTETPLWILCHVLQHEIFLVSGIKEPMESRSSLVSCNTVNITTGKFSLSSFILC